MGLFKSKTPTVIGIDVTSTSVKLIELSGSDRRYKIESWAVEPLPDDAVRDKQINDEDVVGSAIRRALDRAGCKVKQAAGAVGGSAVITKVLTLPADLNEDDLEGQVQVEAAQFIPYPLDEISMDFHVVGQRGTELADVIMAACRTESVSSVVSALEQAGLNARIIDVEAFAMARAAALLPALRQAGADLVTALFDIGSTSTTMVVLREGRIIYTREHSFGGRGLVDSVQQRYGLSAKEAELAIRSGDLPESFADEIAPDFRNSVAVQIGRLLQYFYAGSEFSRVDQIIVSGGVSALPELAPAVSSEIGVPTFIGNPLADMARAGRVPARAIDEGHSMMIACGLALRSFD